MRTLSAIITTTISLLLTVPAAAQAVSTRNGVKTGDEDRLEMIMGRLTPYDSIWAVRDPKGEILMISATKWIETYQDGARCEAHISADINWRITRYEVRGCR